MAVRALGLKLSGQAYGFEGSRLLENENMMWAVVFFGVFGVGGL